jgi:steroid 5-alpha reductase family enzyme
MALIDSIIVFVVSLLVGALGIYLGARIITDYEDYTYAIVTALLGAIIWAVFGFLFGWIPLLGPILALVAYVAVINYRYPGGWVDAILISLIAWVASLAVLYVLALFGIGAFEAVGVPGA